MKKKLTDVTPAKYRCGDVDALCPAVYKSNTQSYVIIAKTVDLEKNRQLRSRVGPDETAIEISRDLLEEAILDV